METSPSHLLRRSAENAFIALAVFMGVTAVSQGPFRATILEWQTRGTEEIAIEHASSASLALDVTERDGKAIVEFTNESEKAILLSLPEDWKRREVRRARLEEVQKSETGLGFVRWSLPQGATVSFLPKAMPTHLIAHHPSPSPLKIRISRVDLAQDSVVHDVVLIQEEREDLW
jgi:hypothetical protein